MRRGAAYGLAAAATGAALVVAAWAGTGGVGAQEETTSGMEGSSMEGTSMAGGGGLAQISETREPVSGTSYVSPLVELYGDVYVGERSFVAGNTVLRAAPEHRLEIGDETNAQDNVLARALESDSTIGDETSLAHHALIRNSEIEDFAFVGFQAEIIDASVSDGAFVSAGALVEGVTLPEDALVSPGEEVTTQQAADDLPTIETAEKDFKRAVLEVNAEFAEGYAELYEEEGYEAVVGVGPNPRAAFNPEAVEPKLGEGTDVRELARVVGDVRLGADSEVADRAAIRADEGSPIIIGENADIDERVTFHALEETSIEVGNGLSAGGDAVLHGPLVAGDNLTVGDDSVVFRVRVGDDVTVGEEVVIQGSPSEEDPVEPVLEIPDGAKIPDGSIITDEASLKEATSGA